MKKNGRITKQEERAVHRALDIIDAWTEAHFADDELPHGYWDIYNASRDIRDNAWAMSEGE